MRKWKIIGRMCKFWKIANSFCSSIISWESTYVTPLNSLIQFTLYNCIYANYYMIQVTNWILAMHKKMLYFSSHIIYTFIATTFKKIEPGKVLHFASRQQSLQKSDTSKRVSIRLQCSELHPLSDISPRVSVINLHTRNRRATPNKWEKCGYEKCLI